MFTGIIENQAVVEESKRNRSLVRLTFRVLGATRPFRLGGSVAIDGTCLTVAAFRGKKFSADLIPETLSATTLSRLGVGQRVNLERSLCVGDSVGGHWVTGHVDGTGVIRRWAGGKGGFRLQIEAPPDIIRRLVGKGSVAVDGISFTVQEIQKRSFVVGVTPHTFRVTTLQWKRAGDRVNLELDFFAKLVERFLVSKRTPSFKVSELRQQGF